MTTTTPPSSAALLTMAHGPSRTVGFRLDVLDRHFTKIGELHAVAPGIQVENNINREVKRTLSGLTIPKLEAIGVDYYSNRLRPMWLAGDGSEWPLGVFLISDASTVRHSWGTSAELALVDQGLILSQAIDRSVSFGPGTGVRQALVDVLEMVGLERWEVDTTEARLGAATTWALGRDTWIRVLNDLADLAGFNSGFFDNVGTYRLRRAPAAGAEAFPDFDYDHPARVHADSVVESNATIETPNRYIVVSTSGNNAPIAGVWDVPADAPHSYEARGYRVISLTERQGLSIDQATEAARVRGLQDADTYQWASFAAAPDPRHDTYNVIRWSGVLWREQSWRLDMQAGGEHRHELRRTYDGSGATHRLGLPDTSDVAPP